LKPNLKDVAKVAGEALASQPAIITPTFLCPVCKTHNLQLTQLKSGNFAQHFMHKGEIGSGEGCQVSIKFTDFANLQYILDHWSN